jgi:membrane-associated phospholipid phosphatase
MAFGGKGFLLGCILIASRGLIGPSCLAAQQAAGVLAGATDEGLPPRMPVDPSLKADPPLKDQDYAKSVGESFLKRFLDDQKAIWTSPAGLRPSDATWLMPLGVAAAGMFATDTEFSKHLSNSPSRLKYSNDFSNYGLGSMVAVGAGFYVLGHITHDDHKRETGLLAGEAAVDGTVVDYGLKYTLGRERPQQDSYRGNFWQGGDSFPSEHATAAWAIASVIAHEYPGPLTQIMAYGMASAVSLSRLPAKQHFPSDVLIGSAIGWFIGQHVYNAHHDPEIGGGSWNSYPEYGHSEELRQPRDMGSPFVPLDSWVYPVFTRLFALGFIKTGMENSQPWTRMECARLTEEASESLSSGMSGEAIAAPLVSRLQGEFAREIDLLSGGRNFSASLESIYARGVSISGPPLTDGYHFGQTISYDFGRPFERGMNAQLGGSFRAEAGPIAIYIRTEYQHAPSAPPPSTLVQQVIAQVDLIPQQPALPVRAINQIQFLDAYIAVNLGNLQLSAGRQSFSWAPGLGGSLIWSDNALPVTMVRLVNPEPFQLPGVLKFLGSVRVDQFFGQLVGHPIVPHPFIYGNMVNFKPVSFLEIGYERTATIGGKGGVPLTPNNFIHSFFGQTLGPSDTVPGNSHGSFVWTLHVPRLRNSVVFYGEWYAEDSFVGWLDPPRNPFRPGIYIARIPGIPKLDLHIEATSTESPGYKNNGHLNYWDDSYRDGYTNDGKLIGNTVGREGQTYQGWLTYWISPRDTVQLVYKNNSVDHLFIPGGGKWQDYSIRSQVYLRSGFYLKSNMQYEHISSFPVLFTGAVNNFSATIEIGFMPGERN